MSREGYPPGVGGVKQVETGQLWVSRCPIFDVAGRIPPRCWGGLNELKRGGGGFHTTPFSMPRERQGRRQIRRHPLLILLPPRSLPRLASAHSLITPLSSMLGVWCAGVVSIGDDVVG